MFIRSTQIRHEPSLSQINETVKPDFLQIFEVDVRRGGGEGVHGENGVGVDDLTLSRDETVYRGNSLHVFELKT